MRLHQRLRQCLAVIRASMVLASAGFSIAHGDDIAQKQATRIVQKYDGIFTHPPEQVNSGTSTDSPLLGNGDLGVALMGNIDMLCFVLGKNEFWSLKDGRVKAMARLNLSLPGMAGATYHMEQDLAKAEVRGAFAQGSDNAVSTKTWVQGDDTKNNLLITTLTNTGSKPQAASISFACGNQNSNDATVGSAVDVLYIDVNADKEKTEDAYPTCRVRVATSVIGTEAIVSGETLHFTINAGQSATLLTSVVSNYDSDSHESQALDVLNKTTTDIATLYASHQAYWKNFYGKSFVEIPDKRLEAEWYGSLYLMASCSRAGEAPPGLFGNWILQDPSWNGDYTLNYNYEAPFWMTPATNHLELSENYDKPLLDWLPNAEALAKKRGWTGAYYQVHIGPLPNGSNDKNEHNQKFCGALAANPILMRYYSTRDLAYAARVYPMLKQLAIFWQNYLVSDGTHFIIKDDAQQEGDKDPQVNGVLSLGAVRYLLQGCIDVSTDLHVDDSLRDTWRDRLEKLSPFPTFEREGKTVFRYTETGRDWCGDNTIGIQPIYPGSQIGLGSDPALIQTAKNMIDEMARWNDGNGTNTFYPAAARVGYDPNAILQHLDEFVKNNAYPNFYIHTNGGGVEGFNVVPATICEMLLQSFQGEIRLFPDWPAGMPARFGDLRSDGGFLVSSAKQNGTVQYVRIISEAGRKAVLLNPWPDQPVSLSRNGKFSETLNGLLLTIPTSANETLLVAPTITSTSSIMDQLRAPLNAADDHS